MTVAAIICEYNPFHRGHQFHIEETKRQTHADAIVAVMSGNFVQRGEVAVYPKEVRAKAAILGGADLVIELPAVFSTASAEFFAKGAIGIINALGIVDYLSFGAETPDVDKLFDIAQILADEPRDFCNKLKEYSKSGLSFPTARAKSVGDLLGSEAEGILSSPNNILGIEYLKACITSNSCITPISIPRKGADHDSASTSSGIASATYIRSLLKCNNPDLSFAYVPDFAQKLFSESVPHFVDEIEKAIICELLKMPAKNLKSISDVSEGLENRIKSAALTESTLDALIDSIKTKRYTHSRIRRIILSAFLGITDADRRQEPSYIKVLDHNEVGQKLIGTAKKAATLPIVRNTSQVNKLADPKIKALWERERVFDTIYKMTTSK